MGWPYMKEIVSLADRRNRFLNGVEDIESVIFHSGGTPQKGGNTIKTYPCWNVLS